MEPTTTQLGMWSLKPKANPSSINSPSVADKHASVTALYSLLRSTYLDEIQVGFDFVVFSSVSVFDISVYMHIQNNNNKDNTLKPVK
jgi:hypothetical protein